ncbi:MAG: metal ABC transporter permease [Firmicutes bacterium]|jgi:ABC-type Mn2+/Zn2+ transport system permease subunit|nr:metal ABC transporter permease [Bacillota bacterium]
MIIYPFMLRALAAALIVGITCSTVGVFVVLNGLSFIGAGIAHAAFAGVALAFLLSWNPFALGLAFSLGVALLIAWGRKRALQLDASIGILFALTMALAVLFIGLMRQYNTELFSYLFGSIFAVAASELWAMAIVSLIALALLILFFKEFEFMAFDLEMAQATGLPTDFLFALLLCLIALTVMISLKAVGELLVVAFIVIPASTALQLTHSLKKAMGIAASLGAAGAVLGLFLSYVFDIPSGSSIVLILATLFIIVSFVSPRLPSRDEGQSSPPG